MGIVDHVNSENYASLDCACILRCHVQGSVSGLVDGAGRYREILQMGLVSCGLVSDSKEAGGFIFATIFDKRGPNLPGCGVGWAVVLLRAIEDAGGLASVDVGFDSSPLAVICAAVNKTFDHNSVAGVNSDVLDMTTRVFIIVRIMRSVVDRSLMAAILVTVNESGRQSVQEIAIKVPAAKFPGPGLENVGSVDIIKTQRRRRVAVAI